MGTHCCLQSPMGTHCCLQSPMGTHYLLSAELRGQTLLSAEHHGHTLEQTWADITVCSPVVCHLILEWLSEHGFVGFVHGQNFCQRSDVSLPGSFGFCGHVSLVSPIQCTLGRVVISCPTGFFNFFISDSLNFSFTPIMRCDLCC